MGLFATSLAPIGGVVSATTVNVGSSQTIVKETSTFSGPPFVTTPPQGRVTTGVNTVSATGFGLSVLAFAQELTGQTPPTSNSGPAWNKVRITINLDSPADISFSAFQIGAPDFGTSTFTYENTGTLINAGSVLTNVTGPQYFLASIYSKGSIEIGLSTTVNVGAPTGGSGVVPEPASCAIFGALGLGALIARRRRVSK